MRVSGGELWSKNPSETRPGSRGCIGPGGVQGQSLLRGRGVGGPKRIIWFLRHVWDLSWLSHSHRELERRTCLIFSPLWDFFFIPLKINWPVSDMTFVVDWAVLKKVIYLSLVSEECSPAWSMQSSWVWCWLSLPLLMHHKTCAVSHSPLLTHKWTHARTLPQQSFLNPTL